MLYNRVSNLCCGLVWQNCVAGLRVKSVLRACAEAGGQELVMVEQFLCRSGKVIPENLAKRSQRFRGTIEQVDQRLQFRS